jgi:iron complex transport system permease protein
VGAADISIFSMNIIDKDIILNYRLPRVLFSALIGAILGFSGSLYQLILKNPLADGFTTGAASMAGLGAAISIIIGLNIYYIPFVSFIFAIIGIFFVYTIASRNGYINPVTMILAGVVLNIFSSAIIGFIKYFYDESLASLIFFLMGGFHFIKWSQLLISLFTFLTLFLLVNRQANRLNLLALDDASAITTGINIKYIRLASFIIATFLTALAVSFTGIIGFVGLITPHIARALYGSYMSDNLYYSSVMGAILLSASDTFSRVIIPSGAELPVGIITAIIGGVFFFYLLNNKRQLQWF